MWVSNVEPEAAYQIKYDINLEPELLSALLTQQLISI